MDALIPFLLEHWVLSSALVVIVLLLVINELRHRRYGLQSVAPQQAVDLINHHAGVILDIRSAEHFSQGHIIGAQNITESELSNKIKKLQKYKSKPVILVCAQGLDAPKVGNQLKTLGFEHVYLMEGGLHAWKGQGLPLITE